MTDEQKELVKYLRAIDRHTGGGDKNEEGHAADLIELQAEEIARLREGLEQAEEWLSGWMSAEPYLSTIRAALGKSS